MIAAGIEGGSKRAIETDWGLADVEIQHRRWRRTGPPLHVAAVAIARALGVDLIPASANGATEPADLSPGRPTLERLASDVAMPVAGGDTAAASHAILQKLKEMT